MSRTVPLSISRSFSLYTQQWYMSYWFADSLRAGRNIILYLYNNNNNNYYYYYYYYYSPTLLIWHVLFSCYVIEGRYQCPRDSVVRSLQSSCQPQDKMQCCRKVCVIPNTLCPQEPTQRQNRDLCNLDLISRRETLFFFSSPRPDRPRRHSAPYTMCTRIWGREAQHLRASNADVKKVRQHSSFSQKLSCRVLNEARDNFIFTIRPFVSYVIYFSQQAIINSLHNTAGVETVSLNM